MENALDIKVENIELAFNDLSKGFDDARILFITDLHLDGTNLLVDKVLDTVNINDYDYLLQMLYSIFLPMRF